MNTPARSQGLKTPVVCLVFKRPEKTRRVFEEVRAARPERLLVVADGARNPEEARLCAETRAIFDSVDWPCKVERNYADTNLGLKLRLASGMDWVFQRADRAITLEDDCVPNQSFFRFCEEMLDRYADDPRIMHICGSNTQLGNRHLKVDGDYFFSLIPNVSGWATWRRAWQKYDIDMKSWPELKKSGALKARFDNPAAYERFSSVWDQYYAHMVGSWDGQWTYAVIANGGLAVSPKVNMISNIGNDSGVHAETKPGKTTKFGDRPAEEMPFPLRHPATVAQNRQADAYTYRHAYGVDHKLIQRLARPFKTAFPGALNAYRQLKDRLRNPNETNSGPTH